MQGDIHTAFAAIIEEVVRVNRVEIAGDKRLSEDLGIDSLSRIDLAVAAEDRFGIRIPDEDLELFRTVDDAVDYIRHAKVTT